MIYRAIKSKYIWLIAICTFVMLFCGMKVNAAENETVVITKNGQVVDKFCNVKSKYILTTSNTGNYCCAAYVKKFYAALYDVTCSQVNTYAGPPVVSSVSHKVSLKQVTTPQPGDIMQNTARTHVAIVKKVSGSTVTLIEQNWKWTIGGVVYAKKNRTINKDSAYFYRLVMDGREVAPASSNTAKEPTDHEVWQMSSSSGVNLRKSRSVSSSLKATIPYGAIVNVTSKKKDESGNVWAKTTYNGKTGWFLTTFGCYVWGKITKPTVTEPDVTAPVITDVKVTDVAVSGYTVSCTVTDNTGVARVQFPTWTSQDAQDDLSSDWGINKAYSGTKNGNTYTFKVKRSEHNDEYGVFNTHIYAFDTSGNFSNVVAQQVELGIPALESVFYAYIENNKSGKSVTYAGNYASVVKYAKNKEQLWKFSKRENGFYNIQNVATKKRLSAFESSDKYGMYIKLEKARSASRQWWRIYGESGNYIICSPSNYHAIMLKNDKLSVGTRLRLNPQKSSTTNKFSLLEGKN